MNPMILEFKTASVAQTFAADTAEASVSVHGSKVYVSGYDSQDERHIERAARDLGGKRLA